MSRAIRQSVREGSQAALTRFGVRTAGFAPHMPMPVARAGVMSAPSMRPVTPPPAVSPTVATPRTPPTAAVPAGPVGPSMLDRGLAMGSNVGRAARQAVPSMGTLGLMGLGAVGATMLHAREPHDDGRLAYAPLSGSFIQ